MAELARSRPIIAHLGNERAFARGISSDMRTLRAASAPEAAAAIALFVHRITREIGSLAAALGGLDGLVFTAGIGEHDAATRAEVAAGCRWLGLELDARNERGEGRGSAPTVRRSRPGLSRRMMSG